jgi:hypothetical protein
MLDEAWVKQAYLYSEVESKKVRAYLRRVRCSFRETITDDQRSEGACLGSAHGQ